MKLVVKSFLFFLFMALTGLFFGCDQENDCSDPIKVSIIYPSEKGDNSITDSAAAGMAAAGRDFGFDKEEFTTTTGAEGAQETFDDWLSAPYVGRELIITVGATLLSLYEELDCDFAGRYVLHLDSMGLDCPNAKSVAYATYAPSFLAGVAAMEVSELKKAAAIGGMDIDPVNEFIEGFKAGVLYAGGEYLETRYVAEDASGFGNPEQGKAIAEELFGQVDVVFPVAGGSSQGVFEAAGEREACYVIGTDVDQSDLGPGIVIASVIKRVDLSVYYGIADILLDRFTSGEFRYGLSEGMTGLSVNEAFASQVDMAVEEAWQAALDSEAEYSQD